MDVHAVVTGDRQVALRFEEFPDALYQDLKAEIETLTDELYALVVAATPARTGRLRSEERARVFADPQHIKGQVTVTGEFAKAGALEYGAHRPTRVRSHPMRLDHAWGQAFAEPETVIVEAFTRTPNIEAYAFERGPLDEMQPQIIAGLEAVVAKAAAEANR